MTIDDAIIADVVDVDDIAEDNKNETTAKKEKKMICSVNYFTLVQSAYVCFYQCS